MTYLSLSVDSVIQSHNILMMHPFQQFNLFDNTSLSLIISQLVLIIYFYCHIKRGASMLCLFDHGICTLPKHLPKTIVSYRGIVEGSILVG